MNTIQVSQNGQEEYDSIVNDLPTIVRIPRTDRKVRIKWIKPYTLERLTRLWLERGRMQKAEDSSETLKSMCEEPYFAIKEAVIFTLNDAFKLKFLYPVKWRIWAYLHEYTEDQMQPIIAEGKKKLPLTAHWLNMASSVDMRTDWMRMTKKEAEQYRAELLSEANLPSSRIFRNMAVGGGGSGLTDTDAS